MVYINTQDCESICRVIMIKKELLDILACPKCKGHVELNDEKNKILCRTCRLIYEIRDDIPIMLIDEAIPFPEQNE